MSEHSPLHVNALSLLGTQQWESFLAALHDGVQIWAADGRILYANPATYSLFGLPPQASIQCCDDLLGACVDADGKPLNRESFSVCLLADVTAGVKETLLRVRTGTAHDRWLRIEAYRHAGQGDGAREFAIVSTTVDVTPFVEETLKLQQQAHFDALTHLPNRVLFADRLHLALAAALRRRELLAVCMMDLDGFKPINDTLGHKAGDRLLQEVAFRLENVLRGDDTAARIGGDEFALLLGGLKSPAECEQVLNRLLMEVQRPVLIDGRSVSVGASIGVSLFPGDVQDSDLLLRHADQAMYKAKEAGKGRFHIFDPAVASKIRASQILLKKIQSALDKQEFCLYYQPKVDCRQGKVVGLEALVRWQHPILGLRAPGEFLPLIEQDDAIVGLGEWVISAALDQIAAWQAQGINLPVSVNVAARQFLRGNFAVRFGELLAQHPPEQVRLLEVEIVETAVLEDIGAVSRLIHRYRKEGIKFDLDDFGTGYSSLIHLKRLEADTLKIDQSFVKDMLNDPGDLAIVQGVINLASAFHLGVVAEGVEDIEHILSLLELGCDVMQGYGIARPMPAERVSGWLQSFVADPRWRAAEFPHRADFELLLAKALHRHWVQQLVAAAQDVTCTQPWPELDGRKCRLAQWYADCRLQHLAGLPEMIEFEQAHRDVHRHAQVLYDASIRQESGREIIVAAVESASARLLMAIESCHQVYRQQKERD